MPKFVYKARNMAGALVEGELEAESREECVRILRNDGLFVLSVEEVRGIGKNVLKYEVHLSDILVRLFGIYSYKRIADFCSNLNFLLQSGVTVYKAISLIRAQSDKRMRKVLERVEEDLDAGLPLHEALARHPTVFPRLVVELIRSGEMSSSLDKVTEELARYYTEQQMLRSQLVTLAVYPTIAILLAVAATNYILVTVVPMVSRMLLEYGADLPFITKMVIMASDLVRHRWYFVLAGTVLALFLIRQLFRIQAVRYAKDKLLLSMPVTKSIVMNGNLARFSHTLAVLLSSGIPLTRSLDMAENMLSNSVLRRDVSRARERLEQGSSLSVSMDGGSLPKTFVETIRVGEESGLIDHVLFRVAELYTKTLQQVVRRLSALLEPVLMLLVAAVVGTLLLSMYIPIVTLMRSMA